MDTMKDYWSMLAEFLELFYGKVIIGDRFFPHFSSSTNLIKLMKIMTNYGK